MTLRLEMVDSVVLLHAILTRQHRRFVCCDVDFLNTQLIVYTLQELPVWGYGLRYKYGIFQQLISPEGNQLEVRLPIVCFRASPLMLSPPGSRPMA